jgi:hypothetical protein
MKSSAAEKRKKRTGGVGDRFIARLRKVLPQVLRERPEFAAEVEIHLRNVFATRDDVRAILERLDRQQAEWNERFDRQQAEIKQMQAEWNRRHDETIRKLDERIEATKNALMMRLSGIGLRWGIQIDEAFHRGLEALAREALPGKQVRKWQAQDEKGQVFGYPRTVELDLVLEDGRATVVEVKASLTASEVREFSRAADFYDRLEGGGKRSRRLMVTAFADERALEEARMLGVEIYSVS